MTKGSKGCLRQVGNTAGVNARCLTAYHVFRAIRPESIYYEALHRGTATEEDLYAARGN